jgi:hypothetical protein
MRINSAVDDENYYVIKNSNGQYLCILNNIPGQPVDAEWGHKRSAAQWYKSLPDRVHVFDERGTFRYGWMSGLESALPLVQEHGGYLVYMDGVRDEPMEWSLSWFRKSNSEPVPAGRHLSTWELLRHPQV